MTDRGDQHSPSKIRDIEPDLLLDGRVLLAQPKFGYRAAIDPVLLAASLSVRPGERVLDLGCGVGAAALCLAARCSNADIVGLEREPELIAIARQNATANATGFQVFEGDVRWPPAALAPESFDQVLCNPPYHAARTTQPSPDALRRVANRESEAKLLDWVATALRLLKPRGRLTLIHRADRLGDLFACLNDGFGELTVFPLWPHRGQEAKRIILRARKGSATPSRVLSGLVLHETHGGFTKECDAVLRGGQGLHLG